MNVPYLHISRSVHPEQLLEFMHQLPAFANMTMSVRRELCSVMVFEVVEQAGTVILHDKQEVRTAFDKQNQNGGSPP